MLRLAPNLHDRLKRLARDEALSLNEYCNRVLGSRQGHRGKGSAAPIIDRAVSALGESLIGIVLYGSWARDEATDRSDVDVAFVLERRVRLSPKLYREWEEEPMAWEGRPIEAQFVHLPEGEGVPSGFWGELALDGIVLFDPSLRVSKQLARTRRDVVAGRLVRHVSHGQAFWVKGELA